MVLSRPSLLTPAFVERVRVRTIMASLAAYDARAWYCVYMPPNGLHRQVATMVMPQLIASRTTGCYRGAIAQTLQHYRCAY